jgi:hypothetical protein
VIDAIRETILAHDDLGHLFEASLMLLALAPLLVLLRLKVSRFAFWLYPLVVAAWYHGREKAQFERALRDDRGLDSVIPLWAEGWWPGEWSRDGLADFAVPTLWAIGLAIVLSLLFSRLLDSPRR